MKALGQAGHDAQGHKFTAALVYIFGQTVLEVGGAVLKGVGDLCAEQHNHPQDIKPAHDQNHQRQAAIIFAGIERAGQEQKTQLIVTMPARPGDYAANHVRAEIHIGIGR